MIGGGAIATVEGGEHSSENESAGWMSERF